MRHVECSGSPAGHAINVDVRRISLRLFKIDAAVWYISVIILRCSRDT